MRVSNNKPVTITVTISRRDAEQFMVTAPEQEELTEEFMKADITARININKSLYVALKAAM